MVEAPGFAPGSIDDAQAATTGLAPFNKEDKE